MANEKKDPRETQTLPVNPGPGFTKVRDGEHTFSPDITRQPPAPGPSDDSLGGVDNGDAPGTSRRR
jgi:hypothetical protein